MKKLNNPTENFVSKRINQRRVRCWVALLSALVLFLTVNTLKLEADTLERIATCGIEQHVHDESCYDASGALICGLAEHAHTDACFQQRPQRHDLTRVDGFMPLNAKVTLATPMPKLTSNSADGQDAVQAEADYYSDIPTEVGSGIEPPVDEIETELAGEDAAPAVEDAVPLEIVYEDQAEETVQQPEYVINGSTVLLSDILSVLGMKASGIQTVGLVTPYKYRSVMDHIEEIEVATPVTFARYLATPDGCIYGYANEEWDNVVTRTVAEPLDYRIPNLYFCGGHGIRGDGYSSAYITGAMAADKVIKALKEGK